MQKTITLDGGKEVKLATNAATPFRFKQLFGTDLLKIFQQSTKSEDDETMLGEVVTQLAFIMNRQAEGADMNHLSMDDFFAWLEDYEAMDFVTKAEEIIGTYVASTQTSVSAKKK
jgi:hypothetical protein